MKKHNRDFRPLRVLACLFAFTSGCDGLEGERLLVPAARLSLFLPANWEGTLVNTDDATLFEAIPRGMRGVKIQVLLEPRAAPTLEDMQKHALSDVQELAKKNGLKVEDVTQIPQKRGHVQGMRFVHQLQSKQLALTHIVDLLPLEGKAVVVLVLGSKEQVDTVGPEIERILSSVRSLTPEPDSARTYPPDAVTGASQKVLQRWLR